MGLKILINLAKKVPGQQEYSSVQASCSIEGELMVGQDAAAESARLFAQAEAAVDRQLGIAHAQPTPAPLSPSSASVTAPAASSRPSPSYPSGNGRRAPAAISAAQLRFLRQLCDRIPGAHDRILADHRVASIEALSSRTASTVIDQLKAASA